MATSGDKLRSLMEAKGVSQLRLAKLTDVPQTTISAAVNNKHGLSWSQVQAIAKVLGASCMDLMDDDVPLPPPTEERGPGRPRKSPLEEFGEVLAKAVEFREADDARRAGAKPLAKKKPVKKRGRSG